MNSLPIRVMILDQWDERPLEVQPTDTVAEVKARVLTGARIFEPPEDYVIKYRGAELPEGATTMADIGIVPNAPLIVLLRRRVPVR